MDEKNLSFYYLFFQYIKMLPNDVGLDGNVCSRQGQAALTALTDVLKESVWVIIVCCFFTVGSGEFLQASCL